MLFEARRRLRSVPLGRARIYETCASSPFGAAQPERITTMNNLLNIKTPAESIAQIRKADFNLSNHSIGNLRLAYWNLVTEALYEEAVFRGEGATSTGGPFIANTGKHTARSANDKFVVPHSYSAKNI